jgi:spermidine/putrescine transport system ATP-binding protein
MNALVDIRDVSHSFGAQRVLKGISLGIQAGSYTVLLGPSGSGKTTLLSVLGGFLVPDQGQVYIAGKDCSDTPPAKRPTTTVFQDYALFPHMSVGANVGFGLRMRGVGGAARASRAREALALVGLAEAFDRKPHQLSGGQRQRVALARALVVEPAVLLLDEPLGALDLKLRRQMQDELKALQKRVGTAFVHVTHDQEEAMALADHCVIMSDGRIEDQAAPEQLYARPATRFAAAFMGESTLIDGRVVRSEGGGVNVETRVGTVTLTGAASEGAAVWLAIRPENIRADPTGGGTSLGEAIITDIVFQGASKRMLARSLADPAVEFIVKLPAQTPLRQGDHIALSCRTEDIILLLK